MQIHAVINAVRVHTKTPLLYKSLNLRQSKALCLHLDLLSRRVASLIDAQTPTRMQGSEVKEKRPPRIFLIA